MGQPVVHFEVMGNDAAALQSFYGDLFGWKFNADNPMNYAMVDAADNPPGGSGTSGIAGGIGQMPEGHLLAEHAPETARVRQRADQHERRLAPRGVMQLEPVPLDLLPGRVLDLHRRCPPGSLLAD